MSLILGIAIGIGITLALQEAPICLVCEHKIKAEEREP